MSEWCMPLPQHQHRAYWTRPWIYCKPLCLSRGGINRRLFGNSKQIELWTLQSLNQRLSLKNHPHVVSCLAWSPKSLKSGPLLELFMFRAFCFVSNFLFIARGRHLLGMLGLAVPSVVVCAAKQLTGEQERSSGPKRVEKSAPWVAFRLESCFGVNT